MENCSSFEEVEEFLVSWGMKFSENSKVIAENRLTKINKIYLVLNRACFNRMILEAKQKLSEQAAYIIEYSFNQNHKDEFELEILFDQFKINYQSLLLCQTYKNLSEVASKFNVEKDNVEVNLCGEVIIKTGLYQWYDNTIRNIPDFFKK